MSRQLLVEKFFFDKQAEVERHPHRKNAAMEPILAPWIKTDKSGNILILSFAFLCIFAVRGFLGRLKPGNVPAGADRRLPFPVSPNGGILSSKTGPGFLK